MKIRIEMISSGKPTHVLIMHHHHPSLGSGRKVCLNMQDVDDDDDDDNDDDEDDGDEGEADWLDCAPVFNNEISLSSMKCKQTRTLDQWFRS